MIEELQKPENIEQIKYLEHFRNLENVSELGSKRGLTGMITRFALRFTGKHIEALTVLADCKTSEDIAKFKQSRHYDTIKNAGVGDEFAWDDLKNLKELEHLQDL